jgi:Spy/CpxP family protein refolding chaperone
MLSNIFQNILSRPMSAAALGAIAVAASLVSMPAYAVSCEDVRNLSAAEQDYWAKRLNLTDAQRHRIWVTCYQSKQQPSSVELARE